MRTGISERKSGRAGPGLIYRGPCIIFNSDRSPLWLENKFQLSESLGVIQSRNATAELSYASRHPPFTITPTLITRSHRWGVASAFPGAVHPSYIERRRRGQDNSLLEEEVISRSCTKAKGRQTAPAKRQTRHGPFCSLSLTVFPTTEGICSCP